MSVTELHAHSRREVRPAPEVRVAVARYGDLRRAIQVRDRLISDHIPQSSVHLVAGGLRWTERPTDRANYWDAALNGLQSGAAFGAFFGGVWAVAGLGGDGLTMVPAVILGALVGVVLGAALGIAAHWGDSDPNRGDGTLEAEEFDLLVDERFADRARAALASQGRRSAGSGRFQRA